MFCFIPSALREKLDAIAKEGRLVRYGESTKFFRIFFPNEKSIKTYKDVMFIKKNFNSPQAPEINHENENSCENNMAIQLETTSGTGEKSCIT